MRFIIWFTFLPVALATVCHICGDKGNAGLTDPFFIVRGKTCVAHAVRIAKSTRFTSTRCKRAMSFYGSKCCNIKTSTPPQNPNKTSPEVPYVGPYKACSICRNGNYPKNEAMVIHFLYIGADTCARYYKHGLSGSIPNHLCSVVQYFAYKPCGCDVRI
jgi:hypothetical protein